MLNVKHKHVIQSALFFAVLQLCSAATFAHDSPTLLVDKHGVGIIQIGAREKDVLQQLETYATSAHGDAVCEQVKLDALGYDLLFMDGSLVRVDFNAARFVTRPGIHIGSPESELIEKYRGQYEVTPDQYDEQGKSYTLLEKDGLGVMFYVSQQAVRSISVGTKGALSLVEGCL